MKKIIFWVLVTNNLIAQNTLISTGSSWKYLDNGSNQVAAWKQTNFNDATWLSGNAELGYGDGDETTVVSYGDNQTNKYITTYFRKTFNLTSAYSSYKIRFKRDDGIAIYFNGKEVLRDNLPSGLLKSSTLASLANDDGNTWLETVYKGNDLAIGLNCIAVEIHQYDPTSSDISFDLELIGLPQNNFVTRGPYLQMGTENSMQIKWRTENLADSQVKFGITPFYQNSQITDTTQTFNHTITLNGLSPNTTYYYSIGTSTQIFESSPINYFITAPPIGSIKKSRFWITGDCGTGVATQTNIKNQFLTYVGNQYIDGWLLLGDNAYSFGLDTEYQTKFFAPYQNDRLMKQTVIWPSPGNHDYANLTARQNDHIIPYYDIFNVPTKAEVGGVASGKEYYYSYNYANIHFVSLDSYGQEFGLRLYDTLQNAQVNWLKQDLAANTQKWTILYWHHPPFTMGSHNSDIEPELINIRQNLLPIIEKYKVDMILCGHSHIYERSKLMKGYFGFEANFNQIYNQSTSNGKYDGSTDSCPYLKSSDLPNQGIIYVVAGSAGWPAGIQPSYPHEALPYSIYLKSGSLYLEIEDNRLDAKWISETGSVDDKFTILKDVNKNLTLNLKDTTSKVSLDASWIGNYNWSNHFSRTKSIQINAPLSSNTYFVSDSLGCLKDTIQLVVSPMPCTTNYQISNQMVSGVTSNIKASAEILASNKVAINAKIKYDAGQEIQLLPGFNAENGSFFLAEIQGCNPVNGNVSRTTNK